MSFTVCLEECKEFNDLSDGPDNILALVEALENTRNENELARGQLLIAGRTLLNQQAKIAELESSGIAPGILRCSECSFVETKNIISVTADTITTGNSEPEPCPNGCGQLQPVNWKALAIQLMFTTKQGVSDLLEAKKRIAELEEAEQKLCAANVTLDARAELAERRLAEMESRTVTPVMYSENADADYCRKWAWEQVKDEVSTEDWTTGDSITYFGFFCWGWDMRRQYNEQRPVTVKLPDIMPPEAAPAHYWGSGESMAYADGYNKSAADLKTSFAQACSFAGVNVEFE